MKNFILCFAVLLSCATFASDTSSFVRGYKAGLNVSQGRVLLTSIDGYYDFSSNLAVAKRKLKELCSDGVVKQVVCLDNKDLKDIDASVCSGLCINKN